MLNIYQDGNVKLYNQDCLEGILTLADESVDVICIDPPYLYLKNQKLEREFNEFLFFKECNRALKKDGFIIMFGRGTSFYRWNTILAEEIGFKFLEEIVWDKSYSTSPLLPLSRVHETISIHTKGKGKILKNKVPYLEMKSHDLPSIIQDIKRLKSAFNNTESMDAIHEYLQKKERSDFQSPNKDRKNGIILDSMVPTGDRACNIVQSLNIGMNEKSIIRPTEEKKSKHNVTIQPSVLISENRVSAVSRIINEGMNEKSILKEVRDHRASIHPTQKPVRLIERLLLLVLKPYIEQSVGERPVVCDFFGGSFSTAEACINLGFEFKGWEIDEEYYTDGVERVKDRLKKEEVKSIQFSLF